MNRFFVEKIAEVCLKQLKNSRFFLGIVSTTTSKASRYVNARRCMANPHPAMIPLAVTRDLDTVLFHAIWRCERYIEMARRNIPIG